jgi:hypothetical protein
MSDQELSAKVTAILSGDRLLTAKLLTQPSAMLIPFMKSRESFYLLTSLTFDETPGIPVEATQMCLSALKLLVQSGIANNLAGIEVVPYVKSKNQTWRLFRLSTLKDSFAIALNLREEDLLNDKPAEGITCGWYVEKPSA